MSKQTELIERLRKEGNIKISDNFLEEQIISNNHSIIYTVSLGRNINFLPAMIELHKKGVSSLAIVEQMIDFSLADEKYVKELTQDEIYNLATIPASVETSGQPKVVKAAFKQLEIIKFLDQKKQKEASLKIFNTILKYNNLPSTQKKMAKFWQTIGEVKDIENLLPVISEKIESCRVSKEEINIVEIDCNIIGKKIQKTKDQTIVLDKIITLLDVFKELEPDSGFLVSNINKEQNKIQVFFNSAGKSKELKLLVDNYSQNIEENIAIPTLKIDTYITEIYTKIIMKKELEENLTNKEIKKQNKAKI